MFNPFYKYAPKGNEYEPAFTSVSTTFSIPCLKNGDKVVIEECTDMHDRILKRMLFLMNPKKHDLSYEDIIEIELLGNKFDTLYGVVNNNGQ